MSKDSSDASPAVSVESKVPWGPWQALLAGVSAYLTAIFLSSIFVQALLPKSTSDLDSTILIYTVSSFILIGFAWGFLKLRSYNWHSFIGRFRLKDLGYLPLFYGLYFVATYVVQFLFSLFHLAIHKLLFGLKLLVWVVHREERCQV